MIKFNGKLFQANVSSLTITECFIQGVDSRWSQVKNLLNCNQMLSVQKRILNVKFMSI